jgi:two-component system sensor histidine kinase CpxA
MRSVYAKVLLWGFVTLAISLGGFLAISAYLAFRGSMPPGQGARAEQEQEAVFHYETGGKQALAAYLARLERFTAGQNYLTDSQGRDLVTGEQRPGLPESPSAAYVPQRLGNGQHAFVSAPLEHGYRFIRTAPPPPFEIWSFAPYYLPILGAVFLLCWILALNLAAPLRELARVVERFGKGDLSARFQDRRRDEIGAVGTAFNEMADRMEALMRAERRLLQDISHELRSPLARIGFAAALTKTATDREAAANRLKREIARLAELVGGLLELTRAEGEAAGVPMQEMSFTHLVENIVEDCRLEADAQGCRIELSSCAAAFVLGENELLRRAVENVLRNAIRYSPQDTKVEVQLVCAPEMLTLTVRDYGSGVPAESLQRIFSPFFRVDDSRASQTGGLGLGLAIAQRAVTLHHGDLRAENAEPGLRVRMSLPLAQTATLVSRAGVFRAGVSSAGH